MEIQTLPGMHPEELIENNTVILVREQIQNEQTDKLLEFVNLAQKEIGHKSKLHPQMMDALKMGLHYLREREKVIDIIYEQGQILGEGIHEMDFEHDIYDVVSTLRCKAIQSQGDNLTPKVDEIHVDIMEFSMKMTGYEA